MLSPYLPLSSLGIKAQRGDGAKIHLYIYIAKMWCEKDVL